MESEIKCKDLKLRFSIISDNGYPVPNNEELDSMSLEELQCEYVTIVYKIHKDQEEKEKDFINKAILHLLTVLEKYEDPEMK